MSSRFRLDGYVTPPPEPEPDAPRGGEEGHPSVRTTTPGFVVPARLELGLVWVRLEPPPLDLERLLAIVRDVAGDGSAP